MKNPAGVRKTSADRTSSWHAEYPVLAFILFATMAIGFGSSLLLDGTGSLI